MNQYNGKRLTLSADKKIAGVCGGFAEYFGIDPLVIRLIWLLFVCCGGGGLLAYLICWAVMPSPNKIDL